MHDPLVTYGLLCLASLAAGALNAVAGGGTLLTFPTLLLVVPSVVANATSTVALVPGSLAGVWGYRDEFHSARRWAWLFFVPCLAGGLVGSLLVSTLDERYFTLLVPWLLLAAIINLVAVVVFIATSKVEWKYAPAMALAAVAGGYLGARWARKLNPAMLRLIVITIGFGLTAYFFYKNYAPRS